jgi:hypothetical protein
VVGMYHTQQISLQMVLIAVPTTMAYSAPRDTTVPTQQ